MDGESDANVALHRKMTEEQEKYQNWLMRQSPKKNSQAYGNFTFIINCPSKLCFYLQQAKSV